MSEKKKKSDLECNENIADRKSPVLFPENVPGAWDLSKTLTVSNSLMSAFCTMQMKNHGSVMYVSLSLCTPFHFSCRNGDLNQKGEGDSFLEVETRQF